MEKLFGVSPPIMAGVEANSDGPVREAHPGDEPQAALPSCLKWWIVEKIAPYRLRRPLRPHLPTDGTMSQRRRELKP
jgi:hypothetical protein